MGVRRHLEQTRHQLEATQGRERQKQFEELKTRALCLVNTTSELEDHLAEGVPVLESALGLYGVLDREDWQQDRPWQKLSPEEQTRMGEDVRELLLLLASARTRMAPGNREAVRDALSLLERAEAVANLPASPALLRDRAHYLTLLGDTDAARLMEEKARSLQPATPRDHYLLATAYVRQGGADAYLLALRELDAAIQLNPGRPDYWAHFQRGILYLELKKYDLAAADFGRCIGIWPEFAWGHFNCGLAFYLSGNKEQAIAMYSEALRLDDNFAEACWNRCLAYLENGHFAEALQDGLRCAAQGRDDAALHLALGKARERLGQPAEADQSFARMSSRLPADSAARARLLSEYAFTVVERAPPRAEALLLDAWAGAPGNPVILYGLGLTAVENGREPDAIAYFSWALDLQPDFLDARTSRALLYARRGRIQEAGAEIDRCLRESRVRGKTWYDSACIMALASQHPAYAGVSEQCREQALAYLRKAFECNFGWETAEKDGDLAALHGATEFQLLLQRAARSRPRGLAEPD